MVLTLGSYQYSQNNIELKDKLQIYKYLVRHISVKMNCIADYLSRRPTCMTDKHNTSFLDNIEVDGDSQYSVVKSS